MKIWLGRLFLVAIIFVAVSAYQALGLNDYLSFENLKSHRAELEVIYENYRLWTIGIYFFSYVVMAAFSLPGATIMTLAGGAIFGVFTGTLIVSFASSLGATAAFLMSRFLFSRSVQNKFPEGLKQLNEGLEREGGFYLFTLRLIPLVPFFVINLAMGITQFSTLKFYWISQLGMLPATIAYVNAGTQISQLSSASGVLSLKFLLSFAALGVLPLALKRSVDFVRARRVYKRFKHPKFFDYNLLVLGAGSGGLVSAYVAAAVRAKVALIEKHKMGGDCLNTGCVPSKALIRSAKLAHLFKNHEKFGFSQGLARVDFAAVMNRIQEVIQKIEPNDSAQRYTALGVDCIQGEGQILTPWEVRVNNKILTAKQIVIATGAGPFIPPIPGLKEIQPLTSDNLWQLTELPQRLLVVGGGPIGCELAQSFQRLGARVTQVELQDRLMAIEDPEASRLIEENFRSEGIEVLCGFKATSFAVVNGEKLCTLEGKAGQTRTIAFDQVLVAVGRKAHTKGFGLETLGIELKPNGQIKVDQYLRTNIPNIFAVGDVTGPYLFTHSASHQAWHAAVNGLFGRFKRFKVDYSCMPWCTFTDPEVARVGLNEHEAKMEGIDYQCFTYDMHHSDRAIAEGTNQGFVKVLVRPGGDKILGVTIVGPHAGEMLAEFTLAKRHGLGLKAIMSTIHPYPTLAEANKMVAGVWRRATAPKKLLNLVEKYHQFTRR